MTRTPLLVALLLFAGCDDEEAGAEEIRQEAAEPPSSEAEESPAPEPQPLEPEPNPEPITFALPDDGTAPRLDTVRTRTVRTRGSSWEAVQLSNAVARARLDALVEPLAYEHGGVQWVEEDTGCVAPIATERLVSMRCATRLLERGGSIVSGDVVVAHFAIDGEIVRPFDAAEAFVPGTTPSTVFTAQECTRRLGGSFADREACREHLGDARFLLVERGVEIALGTKTLRADWDDLRPHLRENGPMAWLFASVQRPPSPEAADADGWAVGDVLPMPELAMRWGSLPVELAGDVKVETIGLGGGRLVVVGTDAGAQMTASRAARALEEPLHRAAWDGEPLALRRATTTEPAALLTVPQVRPNRGTTALRWVPAGTHIVTISRARDAEGDVPNHVRVAVAGRMAGWMPEPLLGDPPACRPDGARFLDSLPEERRRDAANRLIVSSTKVYVQGRERPATLFATGIGRDTHVAIYEAGERCAIGAEIQRFTQAGFFFDVHLTTTEPDGGESLVVIGFMQGRVGRRYSVRRVSDGEAVANIVVDTEDIEPGMYDDQPLAALAAREGDDYWPISLDYSSSSRYRWNGRRLILDEPER